MFCRELVLRPNCLITRKPLWILITRPERPWERLWSSKNPWKGLRHFLFQHGYQVNLLDVSSWPRKTYHSGHFLGETALIQKLDPHLVSLADSTFTCISEIETMPLSENMFQVRVHPRATNNFYLKILDHCIALAERDYLQG